MKILQQNLLSDFHDGKYCHFTKYEHLRETIEKIVKNGKSCVLISGNSDYSHTQSMVDEITKKVPYIKKWYAQNLDARHDIAEALPLGVTNVTECKIGEKHGVKRVDPKHVDKIKFMYDNGYIPQKNIYANFHIGTNIGVRSHVAQLCQGITKIDSCFKTIPLSDYFDECRNHKMIVCPEGNGFDTHRFWETLYIGRVPITRKINAMMHFESLPVVWLDEWDQLNDMDFIISEYERVKDNDKNLCYFEYWENKIQNDLTKCIS